MIAVDLLKNSADWDDYVKKLKNRAPQFDWIIKDGPKEFPCLISSYLKLEGLKAKPYFAIITKARAQELLKS